MLTITLTGLPEMTQRLHALIPAILPPLDDALMNEAVALRDASQQLCPVDTGALVSSAEVEGPEHHGSMVETRVRYGDHGRLPYAAIVEWDTEMNHPRGGQAHYLQAPLWIATVRYTERIANALRGALRW